MSSYRRLALLAGTALLCAGGGFALAGPNGATVVGGSASVQGQGTSSVTINQASQNTVINWQTFNIGTGEITTFNQPNSAAIALNRVVGGQGPSIINGTLTANGHVFVINGDGILFGSSAVINTAGFLATTSDICAASDAACNQAFVKNYSGKYNFSIPGNPTASIVNLGNITANSGGFAALVAPGVRNSGTITATLGTVTLAAGNAYTLDFYGDKLITLAVNDQIASQVQDVATGKPLTSLVGNDGKLSANGGRVELTAAAARAVVDSVINNTGVIEADTVGTKDGMIVLGAATADTKPAGAPTQTVKLSGTISAAGKTKGSKGGTVVVTGENIALASAKIDASGEAGGGHVLIGGDTGGGKVNPAAATIELAKLESFVIPTASTVSMDGTSTINASATGSGSGNGGKVVLWSDQQTTFAGTILAQGGPGGGNGGFVETSSHGQLNFSGIVDLRAPLGSAGNLLLDPADFYINPNSAGPSVQPGASVMTEAQIEGQLALGNVTITTDASVNPAGQNGDIFVNSNINWSSNSTLTLSAYRDINIASGITIANFAVGEAPNPSGNLVLRADNTGTGIGTVNFTSGEAGYGKINFSGSNGAVSIYYNPSGNDNTTVNAASYTTPTDFSTHVTGQLTTYMLVNTAFDLQNMQNNLSGTYALGRNIDASATANWNNGAGFAPIGTLLNPFSGVIDGQGNTVDHLTINSSSQLVGLFGQSNGTIRNLGLTNVSVTSIWPGAGEVGYAHIGALAGINNGSIVNSFATGTIISNSPFATAPDTGGLVGTNYGLVGQSYAGVNITESSTGASLYVGGLVGWNVSGTVMQSFATGDVTLASNSSVAAVGGLVGLNSAAINQSYASGTVVGGNDSTARVGGLVGWNASGASIGQSYATGMVSGAYSVGGLIGANFGGVTQTYATGAVNGTENSIAGALVGFNGSGGSVTQSYWDSTIAGSTPGVGSNAAFATFSASGLATSGFYSASNFAGWNFGTIGGASCANGGACWVIVDGNGSLNNAGGVGATRPFLLSEYSTTITNSHQLQLAVLQPSASYTLANDVALGTDLANPSSMWSSVGFVPIGSINIAPGGFTGTFNGQGHTIDGLTIAPTDPNVYNIGLIASIGPNGVVENLALTNASVSANSSLINGQLLGTLAGQNTGTISNVLVSGTVNGGSLTGVIAGGLVGQNGAFTGINLTTTPGTITQSFANVNVTVGNGCQGADCSSGQSIAGGLVGSNLPGSHITDSQATGTVTAGAFAYAGGLVGQNWGTIAGTATFALPSNATLASASDSESTPSLCAVSIGFSCAGGAVSVGTQGQAGGLVGWNDGIISYAYATGAVTGAAGVAPVQSGNNLSTLLGGLAGTNQGQITFAFATGAVGTTGVAYLQSGGLVGQNSGSILNAFALGNIVTGDNGQAGGLSGGNSPPGSTSTCDGCIVGDGHNTSATIQSSLAIGNVTVGAASFGGGLSGTGDGTFISTSAFGNVTGGANSTLGGLVGGMGAGGGPSSIQSSFTYGAVASTGSNSSVGGLVGINGGTITGSVASGPVSGTSQSYLGGLVGINIGTIQSSSSSSTVTGTGGQNYAGGAVGLNFGLIDPTTSSGAVVSGSNSVVGGFAGGNGAFGNFPSQQISNSSFPIGTISADSLASGTPSGGTGSTVGAQIGLNFPTAGLPAFPSLINTCNNAVCTDLSTGILTDPNPPPPIPPVIPPSLPGSSPPPLSAPPTEAQLIQNLIQNIVLVSVTLGDVVNTQAVNQPLTGPGPQAPPGPGGLPPQFGPRFFVAPPPGETRFVPDQLVLQIPNNIPPARLQSVLASLGLSILGSQNMGLLGVTSYQVHIDNGQSIAAVIQALARQQIVAGAQANYTYALMQDGAQDPNLAGLTQGEGDAAQYAIGKLGLVDIHRQVKGSNISVAVIDSQIDIKHPDLEGDIAAEYDAVGAPDQPHSHGTGMAGAIAAHRRLMGIAPSARIFAVHAFSTGAATAESTSFSILKGLEWASEKGVRVINMSFAGPRDPSMERALKSAHDKGIVLIAAAGNAGPKSPPLYPGADPSVIAVTATDVDDKIFSGANRGKYIAVAAPGVDILVPAPDNTFQLTTGTSVASAEVSGVAALLLERNPNLGPEDVRKILTASARRLSKGDRDDDFGSGLVDPSKAVQTAGDFKSTEIATGAAPPRPAPVTRVPALPRALQPPGLSSSPRASQPAH